jgi:hypothetical protein
VSGTVLQKLGLMTMLKTLFTTIIGITLVLLLGLGVRLWLVNKSVSQINTLIQTVMDENLAKIKNAAPSVTSLPISSETQSDHMHPMSHPHEWHTISNAKQICWIHKQSHKKICEMKKLITSSGN